MPRGRNVGFVSNVGAIAHELGHGAFGLEHTFDKNPASKNNLMDYGGGSFLTQAQWKKIQNPGVIINWFDDAEDAMAVSSEPVLTYVNGYWNSDIPYSSDDKLRDYWGDIFMSKARGLAKTQKEFFINGANMILSSGSLRFDDGKKFVEARFNNHQSDFYKKVILSLQDKTGEFIKPLYFVSHSIGGAFAEGMISYLSSKGVPIEKVYHFSPADVSDFRATLPEKTVEIDIFPDPVLAYKNVNDTYFISNIKYFGIADNPKGLTDVLGHAYTKGYSSQAFPWNWVEDIFNVKMIEGSLGVNYTSNSPNNTRFNYVITNGIKYRKIPLTDNQYLKQ